MADKNKTSKENRPAYVDYYSMHRDPFSQQIETDLFYEEPSRKQRLGTLQHLTQFGNELMIVTGPKGSGKTTMLHQFIAISPKLWKYAHIEAKDGLDERKILQQIFRQMGMEFRGATHNDLLEQMKTEFELLQRKGIYCVMLINDADQLPITAIDKVMEMASLISTVNKPLLRIILFGTDEITKKLSDPLLEKNSSLPQRTMDLPPFTEDQTTQYVMGRLAMAHYLSTDLFTPAVLHKMYAESYGWPARINELARDILLTSLPKNKREPSHGLDTKAFSASRLAGLAVTVSLVISFFIFQDDVIKLIDNYSDSGSNDSAMASSSQTSSTLGKATPTPPNDAAKPPVKTTNAANLPANTRPATSLVEKLKQRNPEYLPKTSTTKTVKPTTSQLKMAIAKNTKRYQKIDSTPKYTVSISSIPRKEKWIFEQDTSHYTLQIVAGENLKTIEEFIAEHKLKNDIAFYRSVRKGKPWYGLIYGIYTHKQAAISAINQLSTKLQRLKPWVRSINSVQNDINKTRP